jgi:tRNA U34 2-thiouridine synthase MnmA/TrmU
MIKPNVRSVLLDELDFIKYSGKKAAVLLSSGVDSNSVLFACMELGIPVEAYSFTLDNRVSRDFKYAKNTCDILGVPFHPVYLKTTEKHLLSYVKYAVKVGCRSKTDFECFWPMAAAFRSASKDNGIGYVLSATSADSHFALSKKANMHYKDKVDYYRTVVFKKRNTGQKLLLKAEATRLGLTYLTPYDSTRMCSELHGYSWDELNKPKQKQPIRDAFPEYFDKIKVTNHTNLQLGDSGIADHFKLLLETHLNPGKKYRAVKGVYNELVRQHGGCLDASDEDEL